MKWLFIRFPLQVPCQQQNLHTRVRPIQTTYLPRGNFLCTPIKRQRYLLPASPKHILKRILPGQAERPPSTCSLLIPSLDCTAETPLGWPCSKQNTLRGNVSLSLYLPAGQPLLKQTLLWTAACSSFECFWHHIQSPDKSLRCQTNEVTFHRNIL